VVSNGDSRRRREDSGEKLPPSSRSVEDGGTAEGAHPSVAGDQSVHTGAGLRDPCGRGQVRHAPGWAGRREWAEVWFQSKERHSGFFPVFLFNLNLKLRNQHLNLYKYAQHKNIQHVCIANYNNLFILIFIIIIIYFYFQFGAFKPNSNPKSNK
jgi:hypothetical protein